MSKEYSLLNIKKIIAGVGTLAKLGEVATSFKAKQVLVITDEFLWKSGAIDKPKAILEAAGMTVAVISDIPPEPSVAQVKHAVAQAHGHVCDLIVGIGGGSAMDAAKLIAILLTNDVSLDAVVKGEAPLVNKGVPVLMVPTTAGTGSEATPNAIVLVPEENLKVGIIDEKMVADAVILDPEMTLTLPPHITAQTGIDALCHAMECYISKKGNPFSDMFGLKAISLIARSIRIAYNDGKNLAAREDMLLGSFFGGICIATSGTTAVHALSYPLGGTYHIPHGLSNAILLPDVMKFNQDACEKQFKEMAVAMGLPVDGLNDHDASERMIDELYALIADLEISCDLKAKGINADVLDELVESAAKVTRLLNNNPKEMTKADMKAIYQKLL